MCAVVCGVHQKEREQEEPQGDAPLHFFFASIYSFSAGDARMQEAVVSNFPEQTLAPNE